MKQMLFNIYFVVIAALLAAAKPGVLSEIQALEMSNSPLLKYPTQFSQDIVPKRIHSHNDYWRDVPLLTALSLGVASVEADVWLVNGKLLVGHELAALSPARTFDSLYVQPLVEILSAQNPHNQFTTNQTNINGVFDMAGGVPLQLLVDMKTDGVATLPFVVQALQPLRQRQYLTTFANGSLISSAVTVVGTGDTPLQGVMALSPRDVFFDAPLIDLDESIPWSAQLSPLASTDFAVAVGWDGVAGISDTQLLTINTLIQKAHGLGLKARFWDTPGWPISARENVWRQLISSGADWLNADDLVAASQI